MSPKKGTSIGGRTGSAFAEPCTSRADLPQRWAVEAVLISSDWASSIFLKEAESNPVQVTC